LSSLCDTVYVLLLMHHAISNSFTS
jgi:hypothetical protein